MKASDFATCLESWRASLSDQGDTACDQVFASLVQVFRQAGSKQLRSVLEAISTLQPSVSGGAQLSDARPALAKFSDFAASFCKKPVADDVKRLANFVEQEGSLQVAVILDAAPDLLAPKQTKRKSTKAANPHVEAKIKNYLQRLDETFGFDHFDPVFEELRSDPDMKAAEVKKIAKLFTNQPSKSKAEALKRIYERHDNVISADRHERAVGRRVAG